MAFHCGGYSSVLVLQSRASERSALCALLDVADWLLSLDHSVGVLLSRMGPNLSER